MAVTKPCFLCRKLMPNDISDRKNNCYEVDLFSLLCRRILNIRPEFFKCRSDLKISNSNFCDLCKQRIRNVLSVWNQVRLLQCQLEAEAKRIRDDIRRHYDYGVGKEQILQNEELAVDVVGRLFAQCWTDCKVLISPLLTTYQPMRSDGEGITDNFETGHDEFIEVSLLDDSVWDEETSNTEWSITETNNDHAASRSCASEGVSEADAFAEPKILNKIHGITRVPRKPRQRKNDGRKKNRKKRGTQSAEEERSPRRVWGSEVVKCGDKFKCRDCEKEFMYPQNVFVHFKRDHEKDFRFFCEKCGQGFVLISALNTHVRVVHSEAKPFKCDLCDKSFKYKSHMKRHRRNHDDERSYMCELCGSSFYDGQRLRYHKQMVHVDKPTPCDLCGKMFPSPQYAKLHRMRHKGNDPKFRRNRKNKSAATKEIVTEPTMSVPDATVNPTESVSLPCDLTVSPVVSETSKTSSQGCGI